VHIAKVIKKERLIVLIRMAKNHGGYFITTFINSSIPLLFLPILTRYLEPSEYANIALFNFYLALSNSLTGNSIPIIISKNFFDHPKEYVAKIIGNSIRVVFVFSLITSALIGVFYVFLKSILDLPILWMLLIPWGSFFYVLLSMALTVHRNERKVLVFSYHKIGNTITNILISLFFVIVLLWGWQGRVAGILISYFLSAIWAIRYLYKNKYLDLDYSSEFVNSILKFVVPLISNAFQSVIIARVGIFFMQLYFTKELLGVFSVAYQLSEFVHLLFMTISFTWNPFVYEQISNVNKLDRVKFTRIFYLISLLLSIGVAFLIIFSKFILKIFTTQKYFSAIEFIPWLAIGMFFYGLYIFLLPVLMKKEKQKQVSIISLINMLIMIGLNILFVDLFGYMGIAYAFALTYFLMFVPIAILSQKVFPLPWLKSLKF
jgi:O-antigen/teichoic acid export membrane protein